MVELERGHQDAEFEYKKDATIHFQHAILLSLLENKKITQLQFDCCVRELKKT
jgi:hypothetical protein